MIDIMAGVQALETSRPAIWYRYWPYQADVEHCFCKPSPAFRTAHLHLIPVGTPQPARGHVSSFERRLAEAIAHECAAFKQRLAQEHRLDRERYTDAKRPPAPPRSGPSP
jgi:GrpB-like predicted nucleotidyltransferase (UPF0157 family)